MLPEIVASMTAVRESLNLIKIINEAKTDAEIRNATFELQRKLQDIQLDNLKLIDLVYEYKSRVDELTEEVDKKVSFGSKAEHYSPRTLESGTFTYINNSHIDKCDKPHYLCASCYGQAVISVLQPNANNPFNRGYFIYYCPRCSSEFRMYKTPPVDGFPIS